MASCVSPPPPSGLAARSPPRCRRSDAAHRWHFCPCTVPRETHGEMWQGFPRSPLSAGSLGIARTKRQHRKWVVLGGKIHKKEEGQCVKRVPYGSTIVSRLQLQKKCFLSLILGCQKTPLEGPALSPMCKNSSTKRQLASSRSGTASNSAGHAEETRGRKRWPRPHGQARGAERKGSVPPAPAGLGCGWGPWSPRAAASPARDVLSPAAPPPPFSFHDVGAFPAL